MSSRIIAFVLLVAFAMQSFQQNLIMLDYVANMATYIESCINRNKPELKCQGKCQMLKKLQAEKQKDQQAPDHKGENKSQTLYALPLVQFTFSQANRRIVVYQPFEAEGPVDRASAIFHPPALF